MNFNPVAASKMAPQFLILFEPLRLASPSYWMPQVPAIAEAVVCTHGPVINIDFPASDSRQLTNKRRTKPDSRRTLGGVTGLADVPLLPPLFATSERRSTVETLCFTAFHLRPVGLNTDDISSVQHPRYLLGDRLSGLSTKRACLFAAVRCTPRIGRNPY